MDDVGSDNSQMVCAGMCQSICTVQSQRHMLQQVLHRASSRGFTPYYYDLDTLAENAHYLIRHSCRQAIRRILSVCVSVKHVICDKTKESCACILIPHERTFTLVL